MIRQAMVFGVVLAFALVAAGHVCAVEMTADMIMKQGNTTQNGEMALKGEKMRFQMKGQKEYTIMRMDKKVTWMVMPSEKAYMEMAYDPTKSPRVEEKQKGEVERKLIGSETIDGHPTKKYEVTVKDEKGTTKLYQWIATDLNFPIKTAAVDGSWSHEYRNIKKSAPDSLFEVPSGYQKMAMPSMPGMGGTGMPKGMGRGR